MVNITNKIFHDEAAAVAHLEASRWSDGVVCPLCNSAKVHRMGGKTQAGMFQCNGCREKFTARTGTVMERSHIPIHKWLLAMHIMAAGKKGVSAKQIERTLGVSYKTAWFLMHRIREAMTAATVKDVGPLGGEGKVVESDETFVGARAKNVKNGKPVPPKYPVGAALAVLRDRVRVPLEPPSSIRHRRYGPRRRDPQGFGRQAFDLSAD